MKTLTTYFFIGLFFSFHCSVYGQFNTLMPTLAKKTENPPVVSKAEETKDLKKKSDKNFWKAIFNTTSKADLKKELDSLKRMIKENSDNNKKKWDLQKVKDSLILEFHSQRNINDQRRDLENAAERRKFAKTAMPLRNAFTISSPYGTRIHPVSGTVSMHNGIDLKANYENVHAIMDGVVTVAGWDPKGGGNFIKVKHFNRFETSYLHLSEIYYKVGEFVRAGFIIAKSGNTGNSTGAHLHFAVRENGRYINPLHFLNDLVKAKRLLSDYQNTEQNVYIQK